jgi:DNA-binding MarR family transcriptional regulator
MSTEHQRDALSADEKQLWRGFLKWSETMTSAVERDLTAATGLSAADFQILARLSEADDHRVMQKNIGGWLGWSATRLSHHLARMQERGLLTRASAGAGRRMAITLTDAGARAYENAVPIHAVAVAKHFLDRLDPDARAALLRLGED